MALAPDDRDSEPTIIKPTPGGRRPVQGQVPGLGLGNGQGLGSGMGQGLGQSLGQGAGQGMGQGGPAGQAPPGLTQGAAPGGTLPGLSPGLSMGAPPSAWGGAPPLELGLNPVCAAATPLLNLGRRLRGSAVQMDVEALRRRVIDELRRFERDILAAGTPPDQARAAHYALCATLDDLALNTPWGAYSSWSRQGLVSTFHVDVTGGERFFDLLTFMHKDPGTNRDVLALMYLCLSIGFEGRFRVVPQGALELSRIRESLYSTLRQVYGDFERELSPHWRGEDARHRPLRASAALWLAGSLVAAALLLGFFGLNASLAKQSDATLSRIAAAPPGGDVTIEVNRAAPTPVVAAATLDAVKQALADEIAKGRVEVLQKDTTMIVRINNAGMFASGSADLTRASRPMIEHIAQTLAGTGGRLLVVGNTDNVPYRDPRYKSNQGLSEARAKSVAEIFAAHVPRDRVETAGRADTRPVASNATPTGREQNRRTDVEVTGLATSVAGVPSGPAGTVTGTSAAPRR